MIDYKKLVKANNKRFEAGTINFKGYNEEFMRIIHMAEQDVPIELKGGKQKNGRTKST